MGVGPGEAEGVGGGGASLGLFGLSWQWARSYLGDMMMAFLQPSQDGGSLQEHPYGVHCHSGGVEGIPLPDYRDDKLPPYTTSSNQNFPCQSTIPPVGTGRGGCWHVQVVYGGGVDGVESGILCHPHLPLISLPLFDVFPL